MQYNAAQLRHINKRAKTCNRGTILDKRDAEKLRNIGFLRLHQICLERHAYIAMAEQVIQGLCVVRAVSRGQPCGRFLYTQMRNIIKNLWFGQKGMQQKKPNWGMG